MTRLPEFPFTVYDDEQGGQEWLQRRCGILTGTCAPDVLATLKSGGEAAGHRNLRIRKVVEKLTGRPQDEMQGFVSAAMQRGTDLQPDAFDAYRVQTGNLAQRTGFIAHNELAIGCSLDGHIGDFEGILEMKCPNSATHYDYLKQNRVPPEHLPQIIHNLWVTGAAWCDFLSYDDRFPEWMQTFVIRYDRDDVAILAYAKKAIAFLEEIEREVTAAQGFRVLQGVK